MVFFALRALLADYGAWYLITLGMIAIVVMLKAPRGLWGLTGAGRNVDLFPVQRRVRLDVRSTLRSSKPLCNLCANEAAKLLAP